MRTIACIAGLLFLSISLHADELVFEGVAQVLMNADASKSERHELSDVGGQKYACRIVSKGRKYYWASRENRELIRADAGDYTYYISPEGTGYVKVFTGKLTPGARPGYDYMEQLSSEFKTFTFWGKRVGAATTPKH